MTTLLSNKQIFCCSSHRNHVVPLIQFWLGDMARRSSAVETLGDTISVQRKTIQRILPRLHFLTMTTKTTMKTTIMTAAPTMTYSRIIRSS